MDEAMKQHWVLILSVPSGSLAETVRTAVNGDGSVLDLDLDLDRA